MQSSGDEFDGEVEVDREERLSRVEARLDDLEELLHEGATESLRTRWAEELRWVHHEYLHRDDPQRASELERRLAEHLDRPHASKTSRLVRRQHLAWAHVCLDAVVYRVEAGQDESARARMPELLDRVHAVGAEDEAVPMLAQALELSHGLRCRDEDLAASRSELRRLRSLVSERGGRPARESLARALERAVHVELGVGAVESARPLVAELRAQTRRALASEREHTALAEALLALHEHAHASERAAIEQELGELASRPGAVQDQRKAWVRALDRAERSHKDALRVPLELLRARAYRGTDAGDLEALFERLEVELPDNQENFHGHIAVLNEMRAIAERPEVDPALRLRFARHWLPSGFSAWRYDYGAIANDRCAHAWAAEAAARGDLEGQVLLGRCLAYGKGTDVDRRAAAECLRQASTRGSDEAEQLLRMLGVERYPWLRHRYAVFTWLGLGMLVLHLLTQPFHFDPWGVVAYFGVWLGLGYATRLLVRSVSGSSGASAEARASGFSYAFGRDVEEFARRPWRILRVATEDGLVLAPLTWLGINPLTAMMTTLVFGLAHYPKYSLRICLYLALGYTAMALLVLPWAGLWSVVVGHVLWDVWLLSQGVRHRRQSMR